MARADGRRRGLALVEVLVCASIAAMMLTATAVAFKASVMAYRDNTERNMLISSGRSAMRQLVWEIRQADAHGPVNDAAAPNAVTQFAAGQVVENGGIQLLKKQPDADDPAVVPGNSATYVLITWRYDAGNKQVVRSRAVGGGAATSTVVARYVQDFQVRLEPARSAANVAAGNTSFDLLLRAVVSMTMQNVDGGGKMIVNQGSGLVSERLVDAAVPRKNFSGL
jgi:Tfp pilus assembly protein PilW